MDQLHYEEMKKNLKRLVRNHILQNRVIYLFGHCNATEELMELLIREGCEVKGILDNNQSKQGMRCNGIPIVPPAMILEEDPCNVLVCIVARASAAMEKQLAHMGYRGKVEKLVIYNSYAEYSLSEDTILRKYKRVERGMQHIGQERKKYPGCYRIYCPFSALGDVYYMMAYLPYFLARRNISNYVVFTVGGACKDVAEMFGARHTEALSQEEMDESIQAVLYTRDRDAFIPHQDRPYVVNLSKALYVKKISLESAYKCGVFGLDADCTPCKPIKLQRFTIPKQMVCGKSVIISPYAKSVTNIPLDYWKQVIKYYRDKKYPVFTNAVKGEETLPGTLRLEVSLNQMQSAAEQAGTFIGLRSGLCDVIRAASCKKIALYPDCYYSDTRWKMKEIYHLDGWQNIVVL